MRIIFLDIDGVVTSARDNGFRDFNLHVVHWLRWICHDYNVQIVLSSTWRHSTTREFWQTIFGDVIHVDWKTPVKRYMNDKGYLYNCQRGEEINEWLEKHQDVTEYVILDDDSDFTREQKHKHFIKTDAYNGMLFSSFMKLREMFGITNFPPADAEIYQHPNFFGRTRDESV